MVQVERFQSVSRPFDLVGYGPARTSGASQSYNRVCRAEERRERSGMSE